MFTPLGQVDSYLLQAKYLPNLTLQLDFMVSVIRRAFDGHPARNTFRGFKLVLFLTVIRMTGDTVCEYFVKEITQCMMQFEINKRWFFFIKTNKLWSSKNMFTAVLIFSMYGIRQSHMFKRGVEHQRATMREDLKTSGLNHGAQEITELKKRTLCVRKTCLLPQMSHLSQSVKGKMIFWRLDPVWSSGCRISKYTCVFYYLLCAF